MTNEIRRWDILSPVSIGTVASGDSELLAWYDYYKNQMSNSLANPIQTITTLDYLISEGKNLGYKAVEKVYKEVKGGEK